MDDRLPTHIEVGGLIRAVQAAGGFATVIATGDRMAGTILVICCRNGRDAAAYERMPQLDGSRKWTLSRRQHADNPQEFSEYCSRREAQDPDLWIVELDIADAERFIDL
jgi:hypothetical protein